MLLFLFVITLLTLFLQTVWYIKNKKGESQGRGKILTKYYSTRRQLLKAGLLSVKSTIPAVATVIESKFCLEKTLSCVSVITNYF